MLNESRGIEDPMHKAFMRGTVLVLDVGVYFSAVWVIAKRFHPKPTSSFFWAVTIALTQVRAYLIKWFL